MERSSSQCCTGALSIVVFSQWRSSARCDAMSVGKRIGCASCKKLHVSPSKQHQAAQHQASRCTLPPGTALSAGTWRSPSRHCPIHGHAAGSSTGLRPGAQQQQQQQCVFVPCGYCRMVSVLQPPEAAAVVLCYRGSPSASGVGPSNAHPEACFSPLQLVMGSCKRAGLLPGLVLSTSSCS